MFERADGRHPAADAVRWRLGGGGWADAHGAYPNPPYGASIYYHLKEKAEGELKIEILDEKQRLVRTLSELGYEEPTPIQIQARSSASIASTSPNR